MFYCDMVVKETTNPLHRSYHDQEYGFPVTDETALFERLTLEVFQAGLSWEIVLKKRAAIFAAFDGFNVDKVASYEPEDIERILLNPGVIRNRLKVAATIFNANRVIDLRKRYGSFWQWIETLPSRELDQYVKDFRKEFKFMGPEVVNEFLGSIGVLGPIHHEQCPVYDAILDRGPLWASRRS